MIGRIAYITIVSTVALVADCSAQTYPPDETRYEATIKSARELAETYNSDREMLASYPPCSTARQRICRTRAPYQFVANPSAFDWRDIPVISFTPLDYIKRDKALTDFEEHIGMAQPLSCSQWQCSFARYGFDPDYPDLKVILECSYLRSSMANSKSGFLGPECTPVMIKDKNGDGWALSLLGYSEPLPVGGPESEIQDFHLAVIGHLPRTADVASAVSDALTRPILSLYPSNMPVRNRFVAGVKGRISPILPPFREQTRVDVQIYKHTDENYGRFIGLYVDIALYVNRYNTDDRNDWHSPSEEQQQIYREAVLKALYRNLKKVCRNREEPDAGPLVLYCLN